MVVLAVQQPHFVRHARSIRAKRIIIALHIDDALAVFLVLPHDVAKNTALALAKPLVGRVQFVLDAARHKDRRCDLRMRVRPFIARAAALILEYGDVFEARVFFEVRDTRGPNIEYAFDFFVAELRHALVVMRRFDDDFVRAECAHLVVHAVCQAARFVFNAIERIGMRNDAYLPRAFARHAQNRRLPIDAGAVERTRRTSLFEIFGLAQHYPTLRDWIAADFHEMWSAEPAARNSARTIRAANPRGNV